MVNITPRGTWGCTPGAYHPVPLTWDEVTYFSVHWDGPTPITLTGAANMRRIEAEHLANGWSGVGYSFVVDTLGGIYEGRGWLTAQAASPAHNYDTVSVQASIGKGQKPTPAMLAAIRDLYDEACRRKGHPLTMWWHGRDYATECPGPDLAAWVRSGMPVDHPAPPAPDTRAKANAAAQAASSTADTAPTLREGSTGPDVRALQAGMRRVFPTYAPAVDGVYGKQTATAVKEFQRRYGHGLTTDGVCGPKTRAALRNFGIVW